jgi:M6 family metalloprotease-like protein
MKFILALILVAFAMPIAAWSVGANPNPIAVAQPDGSTLQLRVRGDEWNHWISTVDGYHVIKNQQGVYEYAQLSRSGALVASGQKANNIGQRSNSELTLISKMTTAQLGPVTANALTKRAQAIQMVGQNKAASYTTGISGRFKLLVIMANFSDKQPSYESSLFEKSMNQTNYNGTGSFRDFYLENSNGQFDVFSTVTAWVTVPQTHNYYGPEAKWGEFAYQAVKAAYNSGVDLSAFDNDGDGVVDAVAIIHQGNGKESTGNATDIWSHSWSLSSAGYSSNSRKFGSVRVDNYIIQPELNGSTAEMASIGVVAHEFGHVLGAYDFYDTDDSDDVDHEGTGIWDLMDLGCYNGSPSGSVPAHHNAYTKIQFGWAQSTVLVTPGLVSLPPVISSQQVYRINTSTENEYYLFENRKKTGFDAYLRGEGMIVYHVDDNYITANGANNALNATDHRAMYVKPASGKMNSANCPFPGASNNIEFHDNTTPSMLAWDGSPTSKSITNIELQNDTVKFYFMALQDGLPQSFTGKLLNETQVQLQWEKSSVESPFMIAFNTTDSIGTPVDGKTYAVGDELTGGGQVVFVGDNPTSLVHQVEPGLTYYYRIWADKGTRYTSYLSAMVDGYRQIDFVIQNADGIPLEDATIECDEFNGVSDNKGLLRLYGDFPSTVLHRYVVKKEGFEDKWGVFTSVGSMEVAVDMIPLATWDSLSVKESVNGKSIDLAWNPVVDESFNLYQPFATSLNNWTMVDNDKLPTYSIGEIDFPNEGYTGSFIVFDGYDDSFFANNVAFDSYSGRQFLACVASPLSESSTKVANDDWIISPEITVNGDTWLSFYAASVTKEWGLERLTVLVSSEGVDIADFSKISAGTYMEIPTEWTFFKYDLSVYNGKKIRFALNCVSADAFMLMIDNIRLSNSEPIEKNVVAKSASLAARPLLSGKPLTKTEMPSLKSASSKVTTGTNDGSVYYQLYRDQTLIATLNGMGQTSYLDEVDGCGLLKYSVVAVDEATNNTAQSKVLSLRNCLSATSVYSENANGNYHLQLPDGVEEATFAIYNMSGQKVGQGQATEFQFQVDLSSFPKGIYTIKIWHIEGTEAIKVYKK